MVGRAPAEQPASPTAVLAHNLNLPFPPGAHAFIFSAALTLGVALSGARAAAGPSLVAPEWPPPPLAAPAAPERRQPRPQRPPPPPPPAERNPAPPRAVPPRTAHLRISKSSVTRNKQYLPTQLVRDLLAGVNDGGTVTLVSQGGAAPGTPRTFDVVYRLVRGSNVTKESFLMAGWPHFLEEHRLGVGQVVPFECLERRGDRVVLGTRINRNGGPLSGGPGVPQTHPGRHRVGKSTQVLTAQYVNDMLSGVNRGDKSPWLARAAQAALRRSLSTSSTFRGFGTNHGLGICHYFISGWSKFVEAHAIKAGQVIDFERAGRHGGRLVLRVRRIIRDPVQRLPMSAQ